MYVILKTLHIVAVTVFLGHIFTGLSWKRPGDRTADPRLKAHAFECIVRSKRAFTAPGRRDGCPAGLRASDGGDQ